MLDSNYGYRRWEEALHLFCSLLKWIPSFPWRIPSSLWWIPSNPVAITWDFLVESVGKTFLARLNVVVDIFEL